MADLPQAIYIQGALIHINRRLAIRLGKALKAIK
jgi:hypothetical protein